MLGTELPAVCERDGTLHEALRKTPSARSSESEILPDAGQCPGRSDEAGMGPDAGPALLGGLGTHKKRVEMEAAGSITNLPVLRSDWLRWKALAGPSPFWQLAMITRQQSESILRVTEEMNSAGYQLRELGEVLAEIYASWPWYRRLWCRICEWRAGVVVTMAGVRNWRSWP